MLEKNAKQFIEINIKTENNWKIVKNCMFSEKLYVFYLFPLQTSIFVVLFIYYFFCLLYIYIYRGLYKINYYK